MCRQIYDDILTLYGDEGQRLNSFNDITIPVGISPLEYARNGFYHVKRLADEIQRLNGFNDITIPVPISPLQYTLDGFDQVKRLAIAFKYSITNAVVCFYCGFLHVLQDSIDLYSLRIAHLRKYPNCRTASVNIMGLDLI